MDFIQITEDTYLRQAIALKLRVIHRPDCMNEKN